MSSIFIAARRVGTKVIVLPGDQRNVASDTPAGARPDVAIEHNSAAGVMTARIAAGPRDLGIFSRGAWNENSQFTCSLLSERAAQPNGGVLD